MKSSIRNVATLSYTPLFRSHVGIFMLCHEVFVQRFRVVADGTVVVCFGSIGKLFCSVSLHIGCNLSSNIKIQVGSQNSDEFVLGTFPLELNYRSGSSTFGPDPPPPTPGTVFSLIIHRPIFNIIYSNGAYVYLRLVKF